MITSIRFRGEEHDIEITHNGGYEEDTNAHDVSWEWVEDEMNKIQLREDEEQFIYDQIYEILNQDDYF